MNVVRIVFFLGVVGLIFGCNSDGSGVSTQTAGYYLDSSGFGDDHEIGVTITKNGSLSLQIRPSDAPPILRGVSLLSSIDSPVVHTFPVRYEDTLYDATLSIPYTGSVDGEVLPYTLNIPMLDIDISSSLLYTAQRGEAARLDKRILNREFYNRLGSDIEIRYLGDDLVEINYYSDCSITAKILDSGFSRGEYISEGYTGIGDSYDLLFTLPSYSCGIDEHSVGSLHLESEQYEYTMFIILERSSGQDFGYYYSVK
ncbi:hypothetical protein [Vibrio sp. WXL103]|uniref:hypothetical protein n=1 Tax=Vibrio sp. WXL103 TaxID=3450710 RepID=UPI003EC7BB43